MSLVEAAAKADELAQSGSERELATLRKQWEDELESAARSADYRERAVAYRAIGQFRFRQKLELLRRGLDDESPRDDPPADRAGRGRRARGRAPQRSPHRCGRPEEAGGADKGLRPRPLVRAGAADARLNRAAAARAHTVPTFSFQRALAQPGDGHQVPNAASDGAQGDDVRIEVHGSLLRFSTRVRMRLEIQLATAPIGYVRVQLGRRKIRVPEHLLHRT